MSFGNMYLRIIHFHTFLFTFDEYDYRMNKQEIVRQYGLVRYSDRIFHRRNEKKLASAMVEPGHAI